jgi:ankyrin repeat protein
MVDYLIEKGAKLDIVDGIGSSPLTVAAYAGKIDILKLLWQKYKQPLFSKKWTALGIACDSGKIEVVKFLIENGADVNIFSLDNKVSPLMSAYRNPEITEYLIKHGANLEHEGGISNSTALSLAVRDDHVFFSRSEFEKLKLPPKAWEMQIKKQTEAHSRVMSVIEILLKAGADPNHKDKSGKSPRDYANNIDTKKLLDKYNKTNQKTK